MSCNKQDGTLKNNSGHIQSTSFPFGDQQGTFAPGIQIKKRKKLLLCLKEGMGVDRNSSDVNNSINKTFDNEENVDDFTHNVVTEAAEPYISCALKPTCLLTGKKYLKDVNKSFCMQECTEFLEDISDSVLIDDSINSYIMHGINITVSHKNDGMCIDLMDIKGSSDKISQVLNNNEKHNTFLKNNFTPLFLTAEGELCSSFVRQNRKLYNSEKDTVLSPLSLNSAKKRTVCRESISADLLTSTPKCKLGLDLNFSALESVKVFELVTSPITPPLNNTFNYSSSSLKLFNEVKNESCFETPCKENENYNDNSVNRCLFKAPVDCDKEHNKFFCENTEYEQLTTEPLSNLTHLIQNDLVITKNKPVSDITFIAMSSEGAECIVPNKGTTLSTLYAVDVSGSSYEMGKPFLNEAIFLSQVMTSDGMVNQMFDKTYEKKLNNSKLKASVSNADSILIENITSENYNLSDLESFTVGNKEKIKEIKLVMNETFKKKCNKQSQTINESETKNYKSIMNVTCVTYNLKNSLCENNNFLSNDVEPFTDTKNSNVILQPVMNETFDKICEKDLQILKEKTIKSSTLDRNVNFIKCELKYSLSENNLLNYTKSFSPVSKERKDIDQVFNKTFDKMCKKEFENIITESETISDKSNVIATFVLNDLKYSLCNNDEKSEINKGTSDVVKIADLTFDKTLKSDLKKTVIDKTGAINTLIPSFNIVNISSLHKTSELNFLFKENEANIDNMNQVVDKAFNKFLATNSENSLKKNESIEVPKKQKYLSANDKLVINESYNKGSSYTSVIVSKIEIISDDKENMTVFNDCNSNEKSSIKSSYFKSIKTIVPKLSLKNSLQKKSSALENRTKGDSCHKQLLNSIHFTKSIKDSDIKNYKIQPAFTNKFKNVSDKTNMTKVSGIQSLSKFNTLDNALKSATSIPDSQNVKKIDLNITMVKAAKKTIGTSMGLDENESSTRVIIPDSQTSKNEKLVVNMNTVTTKKKSCVPGKQTVHQKISSRFGTSSLKNVLPCDKLISSKTEEKQTAQKSDSNRFGAVSVKNVFKENLLSEKIKSTGDSKNNNEQQTSQRKNNCRFGALFLKNSLKENRIPKTTKIESGCGNDKQQIIQRKDDYKSGIPCPKNGLQRNYQVLKVAKIGGDCQNKLECPTTRRIDSRFGASHLKNGLQENKQISKRRKIEVDSENKNEQQTTQRDSYKFRVPSKNKNEQQTTQKRDSYRFGVPSLKRK